MCLFKRGRWHNFTCWQNKDGPWMLTHYFITHKQHTRGICVVFFPRQVCSTSAFGLCHCGPWYLRCFWNWLCNSESTKLLLPNSKNHWLGHSESPSLLDYYFGALSTHELTLRSQWALRYTELNSGVLPDFKDSNTIIKEHHLPTSSIN